MLLCDTSKFRNVVCILNWISCVKNFERNMWQSFFAFFNEEICDKEFESMSFHALCKLWQSAKNGNWEFGKSFVWTLMILYKMSSINTCLINCTYKLQM